MKLSFSTLSFALLVAASLAVGCSKKDDTVALPSSDALTDPSLAPTAADKCYDQCDVDHQAGMAAFVTLDTCMEDGCKPGDDTADNRVACAPIDRGVITYSYPLADHCMAHACCAQAQACAADPQCAALSACFSRCAALR